MSYLSIESTVRHRSVGICYLLDKCIHALIDDIYIDTSFRKKCAHNSHTYKIQLNELIVVCWMKCNMVYLYALKSHLLFWDKDIGKEAIFFRRRKEANEWVSECKCGYVSWKRRGGHYDHQIYFLRNVRVWFSLQLNCMSWLNLMMWT